MAKALSKYLDAKALLSLANAKMTARYLVEGQFAGAHRSPFHGFAIEFAGHRGYVPGDDLRHLDWKVYFKTHRLVIKQYEQETNFVCHLLIDTSQSMRYGSGAVTKLEYAKHLAMCLTYLVVKQSDAVGLATFDERLRQVFPASMSLTQVYRTAGLFEDLEPANKTEMGSVLLDYAQRVRRRGIVIILSDFFGDTSALIRGVQRLRYDNHEVVLFHILDDWEIHFPFEGITKFVGLEDDDEELTQPEDIRQQYLDRFQEYLRTLRRSCEGNRVEHVLANTAVPHGHMLMGYLNSRRELVSTK
jgi:uncharacterized protein (DUF58 family)